MLPPVGQTSSSLTPSTPAPAASTNAAAYADSWQAPNVLGAVAAVGNTVSGATGNLLSVLEQGSGPLGNLVSGVVREASGVVDSTLTNTANAVGVATGAVQTTVTALTQGASTIANNTATTLESATNAALTQGTTAVAGTAATIIGSSTSAPIGQLGTEPLSGSGHLAATITPEPELPVSLAANASATIEHPVATTLADAGRGQTMAMAGGRETSLAAGMSKSTVQAGSALPNETAQNERTDGRAPLSTQASKTLLSAEQLLALTGKRLAGDLETTPRQPADRQGQPTTPRQQSAIGSPVRFDVPDLRPNAQSDLSSGATAIAQGALTVSAMPHDEIESRLGLSRHMLADGSFRADVLRTPAGDNGDRYIIVMNGAQRASPHSTGGMLDYPAVHAEKAIEIGKAIARADPDGQLDVAFADASNGSLDALAARAAARREAATAAPV